MNQTELESMQQSANKYCLPDKKHLKVFLLLVITLCLFTIQCKKNSPVSATATYTGRLVINGPCSHYVIQVTKGNFDTTKYVAAWFDHDNDSTYSDVFTVANYCDFGIYALHQGDVFTFQLEPNVLPQTCPICLIFVYVPPLQNGVTNVKLVK
jgi:hypothetical protein